VQEADRVRISTLVGVLALSATASFVHGQSCPPSPAGIVGWWTGDGSTEDVANGNDATNDGATYAPGVVNEAFQFDGSTSSGCDREPGRSAAPDFQHRPVDGARGRHRRRQREPPVAEHGRALLLWQRRVLPGSRGERTLFLSKVGTSLVESTGAKITDTTPHHVAVTANAASGNVIFYVDSVASPTAAYSPTYTFSTNVAIGVVGISSHQEPPGTSSETSTRSRSTTTPSRRPQILSIFNAGNLGTCRIIPHPMAVDANAVTGSSSNLNGVFEAGETVQISPEWMNEFPTTQGITGTASDLTGPAGPTYTIDDPNASYGDIASGGQHDCNGATGNCYLITISGTRPAQHWDATLKETLAGTNPSRPSSTTGRSTWARASGRGDVAPVLRVHRESLPQRGHGRLRRRKLLSVGPCHARADGGVPPEGAHGGTYTPPVCSTTMFADVPCPGAQFVDWINQLATEGITGGCGNGNYCPASSVTRGQMAVFLLKGEHGGAYVPPACSATMFADVECPDAQFVDWINQLAAEGITGGCGNGNYCPQDSVTRGQMAAFLVKTFGLILYGPYVSVVISSGASRPPKADPRQ
jgi:hypothetical protein